MAAEISVEAAEAAAAAAVASVKVQAVPWAAAAVAAAEVPLTGPWTDFRPFKASPLSTSPLWI